VDAFKPEVVALLGHEREVELTTYGRMTGKPSTVTIWVVTDGRRAFIRSGQGLKRHWPQNLLRRPDGTIRAGGKSLRFASRHVTDPAEARAVSRLYGPKYGASVKPSKDDEPPTPGEQATFELLPL
jgi:deazaflavin-dependent oxidoreductase (nitroreductase family)